MRIDGKKIAEDIRRDLHKQIGDLIAHGITPKIAIITLGEESSWQAYVKQKIKVADELGIKAVLFDLQDANEEKLLKLIRELENDPNYHGIIVQRPLPSYINKQKIIEAVSPEKDIDGFHPQSKFEVPVWLAVKKVLEDTESLNPNLSFAVLGRGETAGGPITTGLKKLGISPVIIDSKTENAAELLKSADIIISAVGKSRVVTSENLKPGVILIGVGTHVENGDYEETEIEQIAKAYTPTPGGIGPINLSFLFHNLITAASSKVV